MNCYWLSFCKPFNPEGQKFLGGCFIESNSFADAITEASRLGCNPGGDAVGFKVAHRFERKIPKEYVGRLLDREDIDEMGYELGWGNWSKEDG